MSENENEKAKEANEAREANSKLLQQIIQTALLTFISTLIMGFLAYQGWLGTTLFKISNNQEKILHEMSIRDDEKNKMLKVLTKEIHDAIKLSKKATIISTPISPAKSSTDSHTSEVEKLKETDIDSKVYWLHGNDLEVKEYQQMIQQKIVIPRKKMEITK